MRILRGAAAAGLVLLVACAEPLAPHPEHAAADAAPVARLLECPNAKPRTVTALIGPLGGMLSLGGHSVQIPSGALADVVLLSITEPTSAFMEVDVSVAGVAHFVFQKPISVTIDYSRCGGALPDRLSAWHVDERTYELLEQMGGSDDRAARRLTFTTPHLSAYALAD